jgi:hypothetical protein
MQLLRPRTSELFLEAAMKKVLVYKTAVVLIVLSNAHGWLSAKDPAVNPLTKQVSLVSPYISARTYNLTSSITVFEAVYDVTEQAGLAFDWKASYTNANPFIGQTIRPEIKKQPLEKALDLILKTVSLTYKLDSGKITVFKMDDQDLARLNQPVTIRAPFNIPGNPSDRLSVQFAVNFIAEQVGLGYDARTSYQNTDPLARNWVQPNIKGKSAREALDVILKPFQIVYWIDSGKIVLGMMPVKPISASAAWLKAANKGNTQVQAMLGQRYCSGDEGIAQDYSQAVNWLGIAAEKGEGSSQFALGELYSEGKGISKDYIKAYQYLHLAAIGYSRFPIGEKAAKKRDEVAAQMTAQQLSAAQKLAEKWISDFQRQKIEDPFVQWKSK